MPDFVYDIPFRELAIYFAIIAVGSMFFGILFLKPLLRLLLGSDPNINESVSNATAGFNLFYGLLLGLLTVAAYQNSERVREGILNEATAIGALYSDMSTYPEPIRSDMREMLRDYVLFTVYKDWDAHREGTFLNGGGNRTNAMRQLLAGFEPDTVGKEVIHTEVVGAFQDFIEARQRRLNGVITEIPDVLWYAVLVGAAITVLLIVMLRIRPLQHFFLGTISSFFLGVILFVIVALDDPLRGEAGLQPGPFMQLWEQVMVWDEPRFRGAR